MHIVLFQPEIPQNTGNIARTCAATGAQLHLIGPLGFSLEDKYLKRAGLDYWPMAHVEVHDSPDAFFASRRGARFFYLSTKASRDYCQVTYQPDDYLVFGRETRGLPENLLEKEYAHALRIPMREGARSLNLANSAAIVLYEALRQQSFPGLLRAGALTGRGEDDAPWLDYV